MSVMKHMYTCTQREWKVYIYAKREEFLDFKGRKEELCEVEESVAKRDKRNLFFNK